MPSPRDRTREQVELYESSGGTKGTTLNGLPVVILTSIGARTGAVRKTALMTVEHQGVYAVVASMGGAPRNPVWYYNLKANPHVRLQDGPKVIEATARELSGRERDTWWERAVAAYPPYAEYQTRTTRQIPVFVIEPS